MYISMSLRVIPLLFVAVLFWVFGLSSFKVNIANASIIVYWFIFDQKERHGRRSRRHIPKIPSWPLIGSLPYVNPKYVHTSLEQWMKKLGPVFGVPTPDGIMVTASNYTAIRDVCITQAKGAGGRPKPFLTGYLLNGTGILFSHQPDHTWKSLRMASQKHLKQFGDGLSHLEYVINDVAEEMFSVFDEKVKSETGFDPKSAIFDAALNTIACLITGVRNKAGDEIVEKMREYESTVLSFIGGANDVKFADYERHPWLRYFNLSVWQIVERAKKLQESIWYDIQGLHEEQPDAKSLFKVLMDHTTDNSEGGPSGEADIQFSRDDVKMTIVSLLLAGVTTTSTSFYSLLNILAHRSDVQEKLYAEVKKVGKENELITLVDRQDMPYCRAVVFELLRYASVVPFGVPHRTIQEVEIAGMKIPEDTTIVTNLWCMHHDSDFWSEPYTFVPERFLDKQGKLLPADHPNRKHLMPFGAGARVCLGEALALARLFLWIASFSQRYKVYPAKGNLPETADGRNYHFDGIIRVCPYKVDIVARNTFKH